jgi:putative phosphoribosyl transferase
MRFRHREEAARLLAGRLAIYRGRHPLVLGVPRGAVPMARIIADELGGDVDVVLVRKIRAPDQPELALGAIDERGAVVKGPYFDLAPSSYLREEIRRQQETLRLRRQLYTRDRPPVDPAGRLVIVVDDGVATGASMLAAVRAVRAAGPSRLVVAIGVAPPDSLAALNAEADDVVCLSSQADFHAVGQFFESFPEVTDEMVVAALSAATSPAGRQPA